MDATKDFQFNYLRILHFLRDGDNGYGFAIADDPLIALQINKSLMDDLREAGKSLEVVYLQTNTDQPLLYQIESAAKEADALIVQNLYDIIGHTEQGRDNLQVLNFGREAMRHLKKPILFWTDNTGLSLLANHAPDLFAQRQFTTLHFEGKAEHPVPQILEQPEWKTYVSSEDFKAVEARIATLQKRLAAAEATQYAPVRIANEIALPLAAEYATLQQLPQANELLTRYLPYFDETNINQQQKLAKVYHDLHQNEQAIATLQQVNDQLEDKETGMVPMGWYDNVIDMSDWLKEIGQLEAAKSTLEKGLEKIEAFKSYYPEYGGKWKEAVLNSRLGDIYLTQGDANTAEIFYQKDKTLREELLQKNENDLSCLRSLSIAFTKLGKTQEYLKNWQEAKKNYEQALQIQRQLLQAKPNDKKALRDLLVSYGSLGDIEKQLKNYSAAKENYEETFKMVQQLCEVYPYDEDLQRDLSVSHNLLGGVYLNENDFTNAKPHYEQSLQIGQKLSKANPANELFQQDVAYDFINLGTVAFKEEDEATARSNWQQALDILQTLLANNPTNQDLKDVIATTQNRLKTLSTSD